MPDRRRHRGRHPDDDRLFAPAWHDTLRTAVRELSWLLTRGYAFNAALKLVGDRYALTARQRLAVRRCACDDASLGRRTRTRCTTAEVSDRQLAVDGYNLLITVESALSGGLILVGRDGGYRDLASVHGTYRKVEETVPAVDLIVEFLAEHQQTRIEWLLDRPVSNSGRLKTIIDAVVASRRARGNDLHWIVAVVDSPDAMLRQSESPVVTTDSAILDHGGTWVNLAAELISARIPDAWILDLRESGPPSTA